MSTYIQIIDLECFHIFSNSGLQVMDYFLKESSYYLIASSVNSLKHLFLLR